MTDPSTHRSARPRVARLFHALSDPTRIALVRMLRRGERCVCDLTEATGSGQSRLSFHLKALKDAGLVSDRRVGRWVYYAIRPEALERMQAVLEGVRPDPTRKGCC
jgi:ArsR family transcriptional regulator